MYFDARKKPSKPGHTSRETAQVIHSQAHLGSYNYPTASKLCAVVGKVKTFGLNQDVQRAHMVQSLRPAGEEGYIAIYI